MAYQRSCVIPGEVCPKEARFIPFTDFIERHVRSKTFEGHRMFYVFLRKSRYLSTLNGTNTDEKNKDILHIIPRQFQMPFVSLLCPHTDPSRQRLRRVCQVPSHLRSTDHLVKNCKLQLPTDKEAFSKFAILKCWSIRNLGFKE